jgi:hypothetical protein
MVKHYPRRTYIISKEQQAGAPAAGKLKWITKPPKSQRNARRIAKRVSARRMHEK